MIATDSTTVAGSTPTGTTPGRAVRLPRRRLPRLAAALTALAAAALVGPAGALAGGIRHAPASAGPGKPPAGATELVGLRSANSRTFLNTDGSRTLEVSAGALNYQAPDGSWAPIDDSLVPAATAGFAYKNKAGLGTSLLPQTLDAPVRVEANGAWATFRLESAHGGRAAVAANAAHYANAFPNTSVDYAARGNVLQESIVLANDKAPASFSYDVTVAPGFGARQMPDGAIEIVDGAGKVAFAFAPPYLRDSSGTVQGTSRKVAVSLEQTASGYRLTYTPDASWLKAPARQFPVVLDPTVVYNAYYSSQTINGQFYDFDCMILRPVYDNTNFCGSTANWVGFDGTYTYRTLAVFGLATGGTSGTVIPQGAQILDAQLLMHPAAGALSAPLSAYPLTRDFAANATWNEWSLSANHTTNPWQSAGGDYDASRRMAGSVVASGTYAGWEQWPATDVVQGWIKSAATNHGFLIRQDSETTVSSVGFDSNTGTASNVPVLWVNYRPAPIGNYPTDTYDSQTLGDRASFGVNAATGNLLVSNHDLHIAGTGMDLDLNRYYNSRAGASDSSPNFGKRWVMDAGLDVNLTIFGDGNATFFGPSGYAANFALNPDGSFTPAPGINMSLVKNPDGTYTVTDHKNTKYKFNGGTLANSWTDQNGNQIGFSYTGTTSPQLASISDTHGRVITFTHDPTSGLVTQITDPGANAGTPNDDRSESYGYTNGMLTSYTDPAGKTWTYAYADPNGALSQITDPLGNQTRFTYDSLERVTQVVRVTNVALGTGPTTTYSYSTSTTACPSGVGAVATTVVTDPLSHQTTYCLDAQNRVVATKDALGYTTSTSFNANGDPSTQTDAAGKQTTYTYDSSTIGTGGTTPRLTQVTEPGTSPATSANTWDPSATAADHYYPLTSTDAQGNITVRAYDAKGNLCALRIFAAGTPQAQLTTSCTDTQAYARLTYNTDGTIASWIDANGHTTTYGYTAGDQTSITHPSPLGAESTTYDAVSRPITHTDGRGQVTTTHYDALDRVTEVDYADGSTVRYTYDGDGNTLTMVDASGTTTYTYDTLNHLIKETLPDGRTNQYAYDSAGNLTSVTDVGNRTTSYGYDADNRATSVTDPAGHVISLGYDQNGNRTSVTYPNGITQTTAYTPSQKLQTITTTLNGTALPAFGYSYSYANGSGPETDLRQSVTSNGTTTAYTYDALNRLLEAKATGANPSDYVYAYDAAGNRTSQNANGTVTNYAYNAANELTSAGSTTFSFDANGNQTGSSAGQALAYNAKDQTTSITPAGGSAIAMGYRGEGQKDRSSSGGTNFVASTLGVGVSTDASGTIYFVRDPAGALLEDVTASGAYYYLKDALGSIVGLTDSTGSVAASYAYDPYGNSAAASGTVPNPFRFGGEYLDLAAGLYKIGLRYYDPALGRWTQQDSVIVPTDASQWDAYLYAASNPINVLDPSGAVNLNPISAVSALVGALVGYAMQNWAAAFRLTGGTAFGLLFNALLNPDKAGTDGPPAGQEPHPGDRHSYCYRDKHRRLICNA